MPVLGRQTGTQAFRSVEEHPDSKTYPGLLVMRFDAGLFFASAEALEDRLRELTQSADPQYHTVVISFEGVDFIDSQGSEEISKILGLADTYGTEVRLARVKPDVLDLLRLDGVIDELGEHHVYGNVYEACVDQLPESRR
jgi:MFS superfamily sulfate permease-like transporter